MKSTTNFEEWFTEIDIDGHEEVFNLYQTVWNGIENDVPFSCKSNGDLSIVTCAYNPLKLVLATEKAKTAFLQAIENRFCDGVDIESWYGFEHAMAKED